MQLKNTVHKEFSFYSDLFPEGGYLDSAASTLAMNCAFKAEQHWYTSIGVNAERGMYTQALNATRSVQEARTAMAHFIHADPHEIVFTKGATEGINAVSQSWARHNLKPGDTIIISILEHHANSISWQLLAEEMNLELYFWNIDQQGNLEEIPDTVWSKARLVCITHISNVTGHVNDIQSLVAIAHSHGALILVDAAQSAGRLPIDVHASDVDFLVTSGHKLYGPTGIGFLYIAQRHHQSLRPYQSGGSMVSSVTVKNTTFKSMPHLLEAGTLPLAQIHGLRYSLTALEEITMTKVRDHCSQLTEYARASLNDVQGITVLPSGNHALGIVSFVAEGVHSHDIAYGLGQHNIAVRAGHHCAQPLHTWLRISGSVRLSFGLYNTESEIDDCIKALRSIIEELR